MENKKLIILSSMIILVLSILFFFVAYFSFYSSSNCNRDSGLVCGENNITYENECKAFSNDSVIVHVGDCAIETSIVEREDGGAICNQNSGKICGSDNITYDSDCDLLLAEVGIAYYGECLESTFDECTSLPDIADSAMDRYEGLENLGGEDLVEIGMGVEGDDDLLTENVTITVPEE